MPHRSAEGVQTLSRDPPGPPWGDIDACDHQDESRVKCGVQFCRARLERKRHILRQVKFLNVALFMRQDEYATTYSPRRIPTVVINYAVVKNLKALQIPLT